MWQGRVLKQNWVADFPNRRNEECVFKLETNRMRLEFEMRIDRMSEMFFRDEHMFTFAMLTLASRIEWARGGKLETMPNFCPFSVALRLFMSTRWTSVGSEGEGADDGSLFGSSHAFDRSTRTARAKHSIIALSAARIIMSYIIVFSRGFPTKFISSYSYGRRIYNYLNGTCFCGALAYEVKENLYSVPRHTSTVASV